MFNIQAGAILNEGMGGRDDNVSGFLQNLRAGKAAPTMTIEASTKVIALTAALAAERPNAVGHAGSPLHSLGCEVTAHTIS